MSIGYPSISGASGYPAISGAIPTSSSSSSSLSLNELFDYPEPQLDFAPIRDALVQQSQTYSQLMSDMLAWTKEQSAKQEADLAPVRDYQKGIIDRSQQQMDDFYSTWLNNYKPIEEKLSAEALNATSPGQLEAAAARAGGDVSRALDTNRGIINRDMAGMGVNPNSGRFQAINTRAGTEGAARVAAAQTAGRETQRTQGLALQGDVANLGRNFLTALNQSGLLGLNAAESLTRTSAIPVNTQIQGNQAAAGWGNMATNTQSNLARLALDIYQTGLASRQLAAGQIGRQSAGGAAISTVQLPNLNTWNGKPINEWSI